MERGDEIKLLKGNEKIGVVEKEKIPKLKYHAKGNKNPLLHPVLGGNWPRKW